VKLKGVPAAQLARYAGEKGFEQIAKKLGVVRPARPAGGG
jgi:hypothetical protein